MLLFGVSQLGRRVAMNLQVEGKTAVILGGTSGIGRATARLLVSEGAKVVIQGRDEMSANELVEELRATGGSAKFVSADIYDYQSVDEVFAACEKEYGGLDIVIASGGSFIVPPTPFLSLSPENLSDVVESRFYHRLYAVHAAASRMKTHGYGKIVTLTTDAGRTPTPLESVIGASAAALNFLVRSLGRELARDGIRINNVSISLTTNTPSFSRHQERLEEGQKRGWSGVLSKVESRAAFGLCTPEDVASTVGFLASPLSDKISGATLSVNGGVSFPSYA
jgi:2-hydroxycyclohexanecarboxyl-CoA dehydrogenase